MSRYLLVPVEGDNMGTKEINAPEGIVVDPYKHLYQLVKDKEKLKKLLLKFNKFSISKDTETGFVKHKENIIRGVIFDDAVIDSCNGKFLNSYESFYVLLKKFGIVF